MRRRTFIKHSVAAAVAGHVMGGAGIAAETDAKPAIDQGGDLATTLSHVTPLLPSVAACDRS